jgi:hypothetical protein
LGLRTNFLNPKAWDDRLANVRQREGNEI